MKLGNDDGALSGRVDANAAVLTVDLPGGQKESQIDVIKEEGEASAFFIFRSQ